MYRRAVDKVSIDDVKSLEKGKSLYNAGRVEACSIHITQSDINFSGIVRAAMKKTVSYNHKLRKNCRNAEIINSDCECPEGKGPHATCKHIAAVLLMLHDFTNYRNVKLAKSATEILQTFHKPKKSHKGSPVKAEDIPTSTQPNLSDPRPEKYHGMEGYNDMVRNLAQTSKNLSMKYMYKKGDIRTATLDHDYLEKPFTEYWVDESLKVTARGVKEIEEDTRKQSRCKRWHEEREWRITASRFGDVCSATNRRNVDKLCSSLISHTKLSNCAVIHGIEYEGNAIEKYEKKMNMKVQKSGLFVDFERPYLGATPDGLVNGDAIVEVKCPFSGRNDSCILPGCHFPYLMYSEDGSICLKKPS